MTEDPHPATPPPKRSWLRTAIPWFFIIGTVALMQIPQLQQARVPQGYVQESLLQFTGKYIVGSKSLFGNTLAFDNNIYALRHQVQISKDARNKLLLVPIIAEISGREAAIRDLQQLALEPSDDAVMQDTALFLQLYWNGNSGESSLSLPQRQSMMRYGWLGRLALSQGMPDSSPERIAILQSALLAALFFMLALYGIIAALIAGIVLLIIAIVVYSKGRLFRPRAIPEYPGNTLLEGVAIYLTGFGALPLLIQQLVPSARPIALVVAVLAVIVGALWPHFRGANWKDYRTAIGWQRGQGFFREVGAGIAGYIAGFPLLIIAAIFVAIISQYAGKTPVHPIVYEARRSPLYLLLWTLMACVWAPIVEETFFRGAFFGYLRRRLSWVLSGIIVALVFAAIHPQGWIAIPVLATISLILSAIREWRGSLIASITAHALNNASVVLFLVVTVD